MRGPILLNCLKNPIQIDIRIRHHTHFHTYLPAYGRMCDVGYVIYQCVCALISDERKVYTLPNKCGHCYGIGVCCVPYLGKLR